MSFPREGSYHCLLQRVQVLKWLVATETLKHFNKKEFKCIIFKGKLKVYLIEKNVLVAVRGCPAHPDLLLSTPPSDFLGSPCHRIGSRRGCWRSTCFLFFCCLLLHHLLLFSLLPVYCSLWSTERGLSFLLLFCLALHTSQQVGAAHLFHWISWNIWAFCSGLLHVPHLGNGVAMPQHGVVSLSSSPWLFLLPTATFWALIDSTPSSNPYSAAIPHILLSPFYLFSLLYVLMF